MARHLWNELDLVSVCLDLDLLDIAKANVPFFSSLVVPMSNFATARFMANAELRHVAVYFSSC